MTTMFQSLTCDTNRSPSAEMTTSAPGSQSVRGSQMSSVDATSSAWIAGHASGSSVGVPSAVEAGVEGLLDRQMTMRATRSARDAIRRTVRRGRGRSAGVMVRDKVAAGD